MDKNIVKDLVWSIVDFLKSQLDVSGSSNLAEEGAESVEVAIQCLETAYGLSQSSPAPNSLRSLYSIYSEAIQNDPMGRSGTCQPTPEDIAEGESLKNDGNQFMREEKFVEALDCYTRAITRDPTNAVFYCNRAASHSKLNNHYEAIEDCKRALRIEPQYSKAYGRMGLAYSALDKCKEAYDCYKKALELEPENESYKCNLAIAEEKMTAQSQSQNQQGTNPLGGAGPGFNLGGIPGLGSFAGAGGEAGMQNLFNNPELMNMASTLMSDPNMQSMMSNFITSMSGQMGGGAGTTPASGQTPSDSTGQQGGEGGLGSFEALLSAGRQLAEQMQNQNPELVEQLRSQMNRRMGGQQPPDGSSGDQQPPPGNA